MDGSGTPTATMFSEIQFVDGAIGQMISALTANGLLSTTFRFHR